MIGTSYMVQMQLFVIMALDNSVYKKFGGTMIHRVYCIEINEIKFQESHYFDTILSTPRFTDNCIIPYLSTINIFLTFRYFDMK